MYSMIQFLNLGCITSAEISHCAKSINECCSARLDTNIVRAVVPTRWILRLATCPQSRQIQSGPTLHPTRGNNPHILLLFEVFFLFHTWIRISKKMMSDSRMNADVEQKPWVPHCNIRQTKL
jgi:hypothetical protein